MARGGNKVLVGRTIGEKREPLETKNERAAARKKDKRKNAQRIITVTIGFVILIGILIILALNFIGHERQEGQAVSPDEINSTVYEPTIDIIDEDVNATGGRITGRMKQYIGQAEADFKDLGYTPTKAVLPTGAIREVDFYLDGYTGFIKLIIDRPTAESVEDADRMLRYLSAQGVADYRYIDVRTEGRAFWQ